MTNVNEITKRGDALSSDADQSTKPFQTDTSNSLHNEFKRFTSDMDTLAQQVVDLPHEDLKPIRDKLRARIDSAKDTLKEASSSAVDSLQKKSSRTASAVDDQVHENPWFILGVSAVVAAALGFILGHRKAGSTHT